MKFFKPEDFELVKIYPKKESTIELADVCNAKLEREGKVVYGYEVKPDQSNTKKALLINIEPIDPPKKLTYEELENKVILLEQTLAQTKMTNTINNNPCNHPIEPCKHPVKNIFPRVNRKKATWTYECECGATVKPGSFVKVE